MRPVPQRIRELRVLRSNRNLFCHVLLAYACRLSGPHLALLTWVNDQDNRDRSDDALRQLRTHHQQS